MAIRSVRDCPCLASAFRVDGWSRAGASFELITLLQRRDVHGCHLLVCGLRLKRATAGPPPRFAIAILQRAGRSLADQRLRAVSEQLRDAFSARADLHPVYRRLAKLTLDELQTIDNLDAPMSCASFTDTFRGIQYHVQHFIRFGEHRNVTAL
jgi:hypothetical protein